MTRWRAGICALAVVAGACSGGDETTSTTSTSSAPASSTTTAPERPTSTTTTMFDPTTVEGQVEAAYLRSWDVYADAVYNLELDEQALAEVYAGASLDTRRTEIERRIKTARASLVRIEHDYAITVVDRTTVTVLDHFINHQVRIDPVSKAPIESDPNQRLLVNFKLTFAGGKWRVTFIEKLAS